MIEAARFTRNGVIEALIDGQHHAIPDDMGNRHRQTIAAWEAAGNTIAPYLPPPPLVPATITPSQLFLQLAASGFITGAEALAAATTGTVPATVDALFTALPDDEELAARVRWARMTVCLRSDPLVAALAASNSLTEEQVDDFFRAASAL